MSNHVLYNGIEQLRLSIPTLIQEKMLEFLHFLEKWNRHYNLTAITDFNEMVTHHLLDSLSITSFLQGTKIVDAGTGAGFPGVPLALAFPDKQFVLLDSNGKKIRFLIQAKAQLNITNITPIQSRLENFSAPDCFDAIIFRAVGSIPELLEQAEHLCCDKGQMLFMKGHQPQQELAAIPPAWKYVIHTLQVPYLEEERSLVIAERWRKKSVIAN